MEQGGVLLFLSAIAFFLWRSHDWIAWSDPARWFHFGRHFPELFGVAPLAYGFPLLVAGAVALVGPLHAFPINAPILLLLTALAYGLARELVPRGPGRLRLGPFAGGVAVALLVARNRELLVQLVSPYRDPLAHSLLLLACLLWLHYFGAPGRSRLWLAGAAASLALGCSTRETGALLVGPLLLHAWALRREFPFGRVAGLFLAVFALASVPMLVHNHAVSGRFWVPAQAAAPFAEKGSLTPGVAASNLPGTLGGALRELGGPLGLATLGLAAIALVEALRLRRRAALALVAPAAVLHLLFYAGYQRPVARYLFAVDLFALPLAGAGAAAALALLLRPLGTGRPARALAVAAGLAAAVAAASVAVEAARPPGTAFRFEHARALRSHIGALVPDDAVLLGDRPLAEVLRTFLDRSERVFVLDAERLDTEAEAERVRQAVAGAEEAFFAYQPTPLKARIHSEFDAERVASFRYSAYGLAKLRMIQPTFHLERIRPWSALDASRSLAPLAPGPHLLIVDVGRLSSRPRQQARVLLDDRVLDERPRDGVNFYRVEIDDAAREVRVRLRSDAPVPSSIAAALQPLGQPVVMDFRPGEAINYQSRLSADFAYEPGPPLPMLVGAGTIDVPTPDPRGAIFVGIAEVEVQGSAEGEAQLTIGTAEQPFYRAALRPEERTGRDGGYRARISFAFLEPLVRGDLTPLHWEYADPARHGAPLRLLLESLAIHRQQLSPVLEVDVGADDEHLVMEGFHPARSRREPLPQSYRWTRQRAELRLPVAPDPRPARLVVRYYETRRPDGVPAADPVFKLNGQVLEGERRRQPVGSLEEVRASFELDSRALARVVNHLVIRSNEWKGRGVMLDHVSVERVDAGRG